MVFLFVIYVNPDESTVIKESSVFSTYTSKDCCLREVRDIFRYIEVVFKIISLKILHSAMRATSRSVFLRPADSTRIVYRVISSSYINYD